MHLENFISYFINLLGRAERTSIEYNKIIKEFFHWLHPEKSIDELIHQVTRKDITNYIASCGHNSASRRAGKISALRTFFRYLVFVEVLDRNPLEGVPRPSIPRAEVKYLTLDESIRLLEAAGMSNDPFIAARDVAILSIFLNAGLRLSELTGIKLSQIRGNAISILGKGSKRRTVYLNDRAMEDLQRWMDQRNAVAKTDHLFISKKGSGMYPGSVSNVVKSYLKEIGMGHLSTHALRHTCATLLHHHGGVDIRVIQEILGHASVSTTQIYTHVHPDRIQKDLSIHPLNQPQGDTK